MSGRLCSVPRASPWGLDLEEIEVALLIEGIAMRYGLDFREYSRELLRRGSAACARLWALDSISALQQRVLRERIWLDRLLASLEMGHTSFYRDPAFFRAFREQVVPLLRNRDEIWIWHAGCASGEEVWSLALLLKEEGLSPRCQAFATDICEPALHRARRAAYPVPDLEGAQPDYAAAGGTGRLMDHFRPAGDGAATPEPALRQRVTFTTHNLGSDCSPREFDVILCRYVLIYFSRPLQERVHDLLLQSLPPGGVLCLGMDEWLGPCRHDSRFEAVCRQAKIFRRAG